MTSTDGWQAGDTLFVRGRWWIVRTTTRWDDCALLQLTECGSTRQRAVLVPFDRPRRQVVSASPAVLTARRGRHELRAIADGLPRVGAVHTPSTASVRILPFQLEPLLAVVRHGATRVLIADDVGLGKTIQAGFIVAEAHARSADSRCLVLVPAGLRHQWLSELRERFGLRAAGCDTAWLARTTTELPADVNPWSLPGTFIASIDFVKRSEVLAALETLSWDVVIVDEAHLVTTATDRRIAIDGLCRRARRVVLLTATPHPGDPAQFSALCDLGRLDAAEPPIVRFQRSRRDVDTATRRRSGFHCVRLSAAEHHLHALLSAYVEALRTSAASGNDARGRLVATTLAKRALSGPSALLASVQRRLSLLDDEPPAGPWQPMLPLDDEPADDGPPDEALAGRVLEDPREEGAALESLLAAARNAASDSGKERWLARFLWRAREPVLVFTEYRDTLARLEAVAARAGHDVVSLHGGLDHVEREHVQALFNRGGRTLVATDAAAFGLNLQQRCRIVVHFELPWTLARMIQRAGRIDRFGQSRRVHEIALVADATGEQLVLAPLARRAQRARADGAPLGALESLTDEDIARLVAGEGGDAIASAPDAAAAPTTTRTMDLVVEAIGEAEAVRQRRSTPAGSVSPPFLRRFVVTSTTPRARTAHLVVIVSILDGDRALVHAESFAIGCHLTRAIAARSASDVRRLFLQFDRALPDAPLAEIVHAGEAVVLQTARRAIDAARTEPDAREALLARAGEPSAARQLAQAGLFDTRVLRDLASARARTVRRRDESARHGARSTAAARLTVESTLRAVVLRGAAG